MLHNRVLSGVFLACALGSAVAQQSRPVVPADYSAEGLMRRIEVLRPDIEAVLGESLGPPITVVSATAADVERILAEELAIQQAALKGGLRGRELREQAFASARILAEGALAKVDMVGGTIYVMPDRFRHYSKIYAYEGAAEILGQDLLDVALAHETTHVFQQRKFALARFLAPAPTSDELSCRGAVMEGHADFVARQVAARRGLQPSFDLYRRLLEIPRTVRGALDRHMSRVALEFFKFQYIEGERFVAACVKELGRPAITRLFADPPRSMRQVAHPEEYLRPSTGRVDLVALVDRVAQAVSRPGWKSQTIGLPVNAVRQIFTPLGEKEATRVVEGYVDGRAVFASRNKGAAEASIESIAIMIADSPESAGRILDAEIALNEEKDEQARSGEERMELLSSSMEQKPFLGGRAIVGAKELVAMGSEVSTNTFVAQLGSLVWEIQTIHSRLVKAGESRPASAPAAEGAKSGTGEPEFGTREYVEALARKVLAVAESAPAAPESRTRESRPAAAAPVSIVSVDGRVSIGDRPPREFEVRLWDVGPTHEVVTLKAKGGKFTADLPAGRCFVGRIVADGDDHDELIGNAITIAEGKPFELDLDEPDVVTILALDAATGERIRDARVYQLNREFTFLPGVKDLPPFTRLLDPPARTGADGRVRLIRNRRGTDGSYAYVVADGRGWKGVKLEKTSAGSDTSVSLRTGGRLAIQVEGWPGSALAQISIAAVESDEKDDVRNAIDGAASRSRAATRPSDRFVRMGALPWQRVVLSDPDARGLVTVEGLREGEWVVMIERSKEMSGIPTRFPGTPTLLAATMATVKPGAESTARLVVPELPPPVALRGRIAIPPGWSGADGWDVELIGDDDLTDGVHEKLDLSGDAKAIEFTAARVTPGRYRLLIDEIGWEVSANVQGPEPRFEYDLPAPWKLKVRVESADGKRAPAETKVRWARPVASSSGEDSDADSDFDWHDARALGRAKGFGVTVVPGPIHVEVTAPGCAREFRSFDAKEGGSEEVAVTLLPAGTLEIELGKDSHRLVLLKLTRVGSSDVVKIDPTGGGKVEGLVPGDYVVTLAESWNEILRLDPPEQRVTIKAGETTKIRLTISRRRDEDEKK